MQEIFEKIIEKLEELQNYACFPTEWVNAEQSNIHSYYANKLTEILKLTEQYNNGWIPCSERLPKENGYYYVTQIVKSVSTGERIEIEKDYVEFSRGEWRRAKHLEVIAWIDIEPYQPKGE